MVDDIPGWEGARVSESQSDRGMKRLSIRGAKASLTLLMQPPKLRRTSNDYPHCGERELSLVVLRSRFGNGHFS